METQGYALPTVNYSPVGSSSLLAPTVQTPAMAPVYTQQVQQSGYTQVQVSQPQPWQQGQVQQPWQQTVSTTTTNVPQQAPGSPHVVQYNRDVYTKKKKTSIVGCYSLLVFAVIAMILLVVTIFIPGSATTKILALVIAMIFAIIFALLIWLTCRIMWLSWGMVVVATVIWIVMLILVYNNIVKIQT